MATQRRTLFQKLGSPMVMLALGAFEIVLGFSYLAQPRLRGQAAFLLSIGVLLVGAGALIKRGEMRRARTPTEKKTTRRANRRAAPVAARARGPKAGAGKRLAGPTRQKPEEKPKTLTERVFGGREKGGLGGEHEGGAPPRATTDPPRRRIVRPPIQKGGMGGREAPERSEHEGGAPPRATTDPPRRRIVRPPIQKSAEERPPKA